MAEKKNFTSSPKGETRVTANAGDSTGFTSVSYPTIEDEWTEADAKAFIDELVSRNKEALRGLAKL